jgi:hypothetical protein
LGRPLPGLRRYSLSRHMHGVRGERYYLIFVSFLKQVPARRPTPGRHYKLHRKVQ